MEIKNIENTLLKKAVLFKKDKSFKELTSFKTGGKCAFAVYPKNADEVIFIRELAEKEKIPFIILGKGTNVLAPDEDFEGIVLVTKESLNKVSVKNNKIYAEAGATLTNICLNAKENSLTGLEFAYGIPGSVGGAVLMNAGAYGGEVKDVIEEVTFLDEKNLLHTLKNKDCGFSYRTSVFDNKKCFILSAVFSLKEGARDEIASKMEEILNKRKDKQPLEFPSAGSAFKRPEGYFAAALIDECDLKGLRVGGACVSNKHAGFIINDRGATSNEVKALFEKVARTVYEQKGVALEPEVRFL